jgi:hypothetical protein
MASGLEPGHHRRWKSSFGATLGDRGYIYLISDFSQAVRWAAKQDYLYRADGKRTKTIILVLRNVPTEGLEHDTNIEGQLAGNTWYRVKAIIPPKDIVRVIPLTPELTKQVVNNGTAAVPPDETAVVADDPNARTAWPSETR